MKIRPFERRSSFGAICGGQELDHSTNGGRRFRGFSVAGRLHLSAASVDLGVDHVANREVAARHDARKKSVVTIFNRGKDSLRPEGGSIKRVVNVDSLPQKRS